MATIPVLRGPRVPKGVVRPITSQQDVGDPRGAFGEFAAAADLESAQRIGRAGQQLGQAAASAQRAQTAAALKLKEAQDRIQARSDAITRVRGLNKANQAAQELVTAAEVGGDLAIPENVDALRASVDRVFSGAVQEFGGGGLPDNALIFTEEIEKSRARFNANLVQKGLDAGKAALNAAATEEVARLANDVFLNPLSLPDRMAEFDNFMEKQFAPGMSAAEEASTLASGRETIATAAIDFLIDAGQYDEAITRMSQEGIREFLGPVRARELRAKIFAGRGEAIKVAATAKAKIQIFEDAGIEVTPVILAAITTGINLTPPKPARTLADKVVELETFMTRATGKPFFATPAMVQRMAGAAERRDRQIDPLEQILLDDAAAVENGTASQAQFENFVAVAALLTKIDPVTKTQRQLGLTVRLALRANGLTPSRINSPEGVAELQAQRAQSRFGGGEGGGAIQQDPEAPPVQGSALPPQIQEVAAKLGTAIAPMVEVTSTFTPDTPTEEALGAIAKSGINLFDMADILQGPIPSLGRGISGIPLIGPLLPAPEMNEARIQLDVFIGYAIDATRRTERFGNAEREFLLDEVFQNLRAAFIQTPNKFRSTLIGLDGILAEEQKFIAETLDKEAAVGGERHRELQTRQNSVEFVRRIAGVPPLVTTSEEFFDLVQKKGLQPGDKVRVKNKIATVKQVMDALTGTASEKPEGEEEEEE